MQGLKPLFLRAVTAGLKPRRSDLTVFEMAPRGSCLAKAIWNGKVIAESDRTVVVEGNVYFPNDSVKREYLRRSETHTVCPWKGTASYRHVEVDGKRNLDAAWYYPEPSAAAAEIKEYMAFWKGVRIEK